MKSYPGIKIHKSRKKNPTFHGKIFPQITELKSIFHGILQKPFVFQWIVSIFVPYDQRQIRYGRLPLEALIFPLLRQKPDFAGSIAGSNSGGSQLFSVCLWVQKDD